MQDAQAHASSPAAGAAGTGAPPAQVVLAHDYLLVMRGAERTFAAMADMYPQAPIVTLLYDARATEGRFAQHAVQTSALQRLHVGQRGFRRLLPLYPWAAQRLAAPACELLLSSSSAFAHGIRAPAGALHVCYCHTPFRYVWHERERALAETPRALRGAMRVLLARMRRWDLAAASRVDVFLANSQLTRERIERNYGRDAEVVHPPVETGRFSPGEAGESLLVVSELVRHKRVEVALEAARRARTQVRVVGTGPDMQALAHAYPEAQFLGRLPDALLAELYAGARAVLVPSSEEFGIVAVEAQAAGRPVIAAAGGGADETILDGQTGRLVRAGDVEGFTCAILQLEELDFTPLRAVQNAERFSVEAFKERMAVLLARALQRERPQRASSAAARLL